MTSYDVVISGAGMVGLVTAVAMAREGRTVLLLERGESLDWAAKCERSLRVSAIAQQHIEWFKKLAISQYLLQERLGFYDNMSVWDNRSNASIVFDTRHTQNDHLGFIIENQHLMYAAKSVADQSDLITQQYQTTISEFTDEDKHVCITLSSAEIIKTNLLVVAEGAQSVLRQQANIKVKTIDYHQQGLVCYVKLDRAKTKTAYQAFNPSGPVGLLPVAKDMFSIVWTLPEHSIDYWLTCDETTFAHGLQVHINRHLGMPVLLSQRVAFPLRQMQAEQYVKGRMVLLGDAAHVVHPLAGQGVNLGLADAACLLSVIENCSLKINQDVNRQLKKYQRHRRVAVSDSQLMINALHHMFTQQFKPLPLIRALGMNTVNQLEFLKGWLLKQAGS